MRPVSLRSLVVHYPVSGGELVNLVAIAPAGGYVTESWTATATVEEFLAEFEGWDDRLTGLIGAADTPGRWALLIRQPLPRWTWAPSIRCARVSGLRDPVPTGSRQRPK